MRKSSFLPGLVDQVVSTIILASIVMAVHRFVILSEMADRPIWKTPASYPMSVVYLLLYNLIRFLMADPGKVFGPRCLIVGSLLNFLFSILLSVISLRLMLIFPAIAVESPYAGWRNAWRDSRGHAWKLFGTSLLATSPVLIPVIVSTFAIVQIVDLRTMDTRWLKALEMIGGAAALLFGASIAAVIASRFLQLYGNALIRPAQAAGLGAAAF